MRIKGLKVENFNTIKSISLEEEDLKRIVVITGEHGNGKSSLLDALTYALTGYLEETIASYIRLGEEKFTIYCQVEDSAGVTYNMLIEAKEGKTEKVLEISNESKVYRDSDATKRMAEAFNPTLMIYSAVARQHNNTGVLFESDSERLKKLKKIFRITDVDDAIVRIQTEESALKEEVKLLTKEIEVLIKQKESIKPHEVPTVEEDETELIKEELKWSELKEAAQNFELEKQKYLQSVERYNSAVKTIKTLDEEIAYIESEIEALPALKRFRPLELSGEIEKVKTEIESRKKTLTDIQSKLKEDERKVNVSNNLKQKKTELEKEFLTESLNDIEKKLETPDYAYIPVKPLEEQKELLSQRFHFLDIKKKSHESGHCLVCNTSMPGTVEDTEKEYNDLKKSVNELTNLISHAIKQNAEREKLLNLLDVKKTQKIDIDKKLSDIVSDPLFDYKSVSESLNKEIISVQTDLETLQASLNDLLVRQKESDSILEYNRNISGQRTRLIERLEQKQTERNNLEIPVQPGPFNLVEVPFDEEGYKHFIKRKNRHNEILMQIKSIEELNKKLIEQKQNLIETIEIKQIETDTKADRLDSLSAARKLLEKKFIAYLLKRGSEYVCTKMNEYFSKAFMGGTLTDAYEIFLEVKGNSVQFFYRIGEHEKLLPIRKASGQQKMVISLAFRNALSHLSPFGGFFVLDEVDESANDEAAMKMYEILLEDGINQLITITHNEATRTMFREHPEAVIYEIRNGELV